MERSGESRILRESRHNRKARERGSSSRIKCSFTSVFYLRQFYSLEVPSEISEKQNHEVPPK